MAVLYLTEDEVREVLDMRMALDAVEEAFRQMAEGRARNVPRRRAAAPGFLLHTMSATAEYAGLAGWKAYTTVHGAARFHIGLYDLASGEMLALLDADHLGRMRTGAASGVATECMARQEARNVGVFGSGKQARTQLEAVCAVRNIERAYVYSPNAEHRDRFAREMEEICETEVVSADRPLRAAEACDIIVTATTSREPVLDGQSIAEGTHLNVIGSNFLHKAEVDEATLRRSDLIACDSIEQCKEEAGDFTGALEAGILHWSRVRELADVVIGRETGRPQPESITLFKSVGLAVEDVAVAARVIEVAREQGLGKPLPL